MTYSRTLLRLRCKQLELSPGFPIFTVLSPGCLHPRRTEFAILAPMDQLWTPWRYNYVSAADKTLRDGVPKLLQDWPGDLGCVFCNLLASVNYAIEHGIDADKAEEAAGLVMRGAECFICLNAYPYNSGHVMVIPNRHGSSLAELNETTAHELMSWAQKTERVLSKVYTPHGMNFGMNLGAAAGAGVAGHLHLHALPRWTGDTNFMTVVGETRVLPEDLAITWRRMRDGFAQLAS